MSRITRSCLFLIVLTLLFLAFPVSADTQSKDSLPAYPLQGKVEALLKRPAPEGWRTTGAAESLYADLSEPIVRQAIPWQDATGRIIDPFVGKETSTATPRFVGALAGLLLKGRCPDLAEYGRRGMTAGAEDLFVADKNPLPGPEFYTKELMLGWLALAEKTDAKTVELWKRLLGAYDPGKNYVEVLGKRAPDKLYNYVTFGLAGEGMKKAYGIAANDAFIERHLATQGIRFDANGMYGDPNFPMTYDVTPRMNLSLLFQTGYRGPQYAYFDELLRRGALTMLLYLSPTGEAPFGGRSNQQNYNEATIALVCEYEARRYKAEGNLELAGAFKRAARMAALSVKRWLDLRPIRNTKNEFPPEAEHGRQKGYGYYGAYSLLVASQFGFANWLADPAIEERPVPSEIGGYVVRLGDDFHKVFATCGGYHIEVDTRADLHYDATGLGRLHKAGVASETALSIPIVSHPEYLVSVPPAPRNVAIGPGWREGGRIRWLSDLSSEIESVDVETLEEKPERAAFRVTYRGAWPGRTVAETYELTREGLTVNCEVGGSPGEVFFQAPLIMTDGTHRSEIESRADFFRVAYQGRTYEVRRLSPKDSDLRMEVFAAPNRNGIYRVGVIRAKGDSIACRLSVE